MLMLEKVCDGLPKALNGIKPVLIYPLGGLGIVAIMMCAVNPAIGMLNEGLANFLSNMGDSSKILLGCVLGAIFSVGTNDLTQYTLACDRQNAAIEQFVDTHHEAVLRLIEMSAKNAHEHGAGIVTVHIWCVL